MEKIIFNDDKEYLHQHIGLTDERADELLEETNAVLTNATNNGILKFETDRVKVDGNVLLKILVNEVAKTPEERVLVCCKFEELYRNFRQQVNEAVDLG